MLLQLLNTFKIALVLCCHAAHIISCPLRFIRLSTPNPTVQGSAKPTSTKTFLHVHVPVAFVTGNFNLEQAGENLAIFSLGIMPKAAGRQSKHSGKHSGKYSGKQSGKQSGKGSGGGNAKASGSRSTKGGQSSKQQASEEAMWLSV